MIELQHHGILGQKWGVRRFQNIDGSYTDAGRHRYGLGKQKRLANKISKYAKKGKKEDAAKLVSYAVKNDDQIKNAFMKRDDVQTTWFIKQNKLVDAWDEAAKRLRYKVNEEMKIAGMDPNSQYREFIEDEIIMDDPTYQKIYLECENAYDNLKSANKEVCDALLGEYGKRPIKYFSNRRIQTVSDYVSDELLPRIRKL